MTPSRLILLSLAAFALFGAATGCSVLDVKKPKCLPPCGVPDSIPRELSKATMPEYVIEPPDVLTISAIDLIPRQPYRLRPLDTVQIEASGMPEEAPLAGRLHHNRPAVENYVVM